MITRLRSGQPVELRAFALTDMISWGYTGLRGAGLAVSESDAQGIPALYRAVRLKAEAVAGLDLCCYSGDGSERRERPNVPQAVLFDQIPNPHQSRFSFWETVAESLAWRNIANVWKNVDPMSGRILEWYALHPDQVSTNRDGDWTVSVMQGYVDPVGRGPAKYIVDAKTLLRIRGYGAGGKLDPPTPIQVFRQALQSPLLRMKSEARMWRRGTSLQLAVVFPQGVTKAQTDDWRNSWRNTYEGADGESTAVIGGGADLKPIGMTAKDAEYVAMANLTVQDASLIMGVPSELLVKRQGERSPAGTLEEDTTNWLRFGLQPDLQRIEAALEADTTLFPPGSQTYPHFETDMFIRGDVKTEAEILVSLVQAGILTPNEARSIRGLEDIPGGDIPQLTPVGGAPNPNLNGNQAQNGSGDYPATVAT
jgi:HK97 family phage portal protein